MPSPVLSVRGSSIVDNSGATIIRLVPAGELRGPGGARGRTGGKRPAVTSFETFSRIPDRGPYYEDAVDRKFQ